MKKGTPKLTKWIMQLPGPAGSSTLSVLIPLEDRFWSKSDILIFPNMWQLGNFSLGFVVEKLSLRDLLLDLELSFVLSSEKARSLYWLFNTLRFPETVAILKWNCFKHCIWLMVIVNYNYLTPGLTSTGLSFSAKAGSRVIFSKLLVTGNFTLSSRLKTKNCFI